MPAHPMVSIPGARYVDMVLVCDFWHTAADPEPATIGAVQGVNPATWPFRRDPLPMLWGNFS